MKQYFSADLMTPEQYAKMGVDIEDVMSDVQLALSIFAQKLNIELLHKFYTQYPGYYQATQPDEMVQVLNRSARGPNSPYSQSLITCLDGVDKAMMAAWREIEAHVKKEKTDKRDAKEMLDQVYNRKEAARDG